MVMNVRVVEGGQGIMETIPVAERCRSLNNNCALITVKGVVFGSLDAVSCDPTSHQSRATNCESHP